METQKKINLLLLAICIVAMTGCAAFVEATSPKRGTEQQDSIALPASTPTELAILSELPGMHSGERGKAGPVVFVVGNEYSAASGNSCRQITITGDPPDVTDTRVVCKRNDSWRFSRNIF